MTVMMMMMMMMMVTRRRGKVVFISSKAGVSPSAGLAVHSGTKHMLEAVAKALRQELSGTGVRQDKIHIFRMFLSFSRNDNLCLCPR